MTEEHLPLAPAGSVGEIEPDLPAPPAALQPLPRPRPPEEEPKPFHAARRAAEWLVAYA